MIEFIALALIAAFAFLLVTRFMSRRAKGKPGGSEQGAVTGWVRGEVAKLVADKLELEELDVQETLDKSPDPDVVTRLEKAVSKVEVVYEKVPGTTNEIDVRVEVGFEDGRTERSVKRVPRAEVPEAVQNELAETGASHVYRPFLFPWQV